MPPEDEEAVSAVLWELGTAGTQWLGTEAGRAVHLAYFEDRDGLEAGLRRSLSAFHADVAPAEVPDVDWVARVREGFRAFTAGSFLVVPAWEATPGAADASRLLVVEPGVAFGTGSHESTRLCLRLLEERAAEGSLGWVADIGAGSGILAVAAARLGATRVVALDLDDEAVPVAVRHAALNDVPVHLVRGDGGRPLRRRAFDVVLANLTAPLLRERADELALLARAGGVVVLSGLLVEDVAEVRAAWAPHADGIGVITEGAWAALAVRVRT